MAEFSNCRLERVLEIEEVASEVSAEEVEHPSHAVRQKVRVKFEIINL